jgi:hypothetical protein
VPEEPQFSAVAALNLRQLLTLGLTWRDGAWVLA